MRNRILPVYLFFFFEQMLLLCIGRLLFPDYSLSTSWYCLAIINHENKTIRKTCWITIVVRKIVQKINIQLKIVFFTLQNGKDIKKN